MGVDLFLCLSSYLITKLLWLEWQKGNKVSVPRFYLRRALRIWPLYFLMCFLGFYLLPRLGWDDPAWGSDDYRSMLHTYLVPHLGFFANLVTALRGYIVSFSLGPLWTISLEEQFYFLWPLFLVLARFNRTRILWGGLGLLVLTEGARAYFRLSGFPHPAIWVSLPTRLDPFVLGTLLALFEKELRQWAGKAPPWLPLAAGLSCLAGAVAMPDMEQQGPSVLFQFNLLDLGWILVLFSAGQGGWVRSWVTHRPFPVLGKISYGLYVFHFLALHLAGMVAFWFQGLAHLYLYSWVVAWSVTVLGFLLTLALASFSYYFYERRFLEMKKKFTAITSRPV